MASHAVPERCEAPEKREAEVWACLERVADPELDEPITAMGFVERVVVGAAGEVTVEFRLPTYWCSPNFAFLMAEGIRREVLALPWASRVAVCLHDHMFADAINEGINEGRDFPAIFRELSQGQDLAELRAKFAAKAFQRRQEAVLLGLRAQGMADATITALTLAELDVAVLVSPEAEAQRPRYRELLLALGLARAPGDLAFCTLAGEALRVEGLAEHLRELRSVRINMEFNGALCRGLRRTRYHEVRREDGEPTLVDFLPPPATAPPAAPR